MERPSKTGALIARSVEEVESTSLGFGWSVHLSKNTDGAVVHVRQRNAMALELTIRITSEGPVLHARGASLELEATRDIHARCERFSIDATESIELQSGGRIMQRASGATELEGHAVSVLATSGDVRVKASDDVQLKGELVLLNCDRPPQGPHGREPNATATVPRQGISGDETLASIVGD